MLRTMRTKAQICLGPKDINIQTEEQENTCRLLYCKDRSTGTTLKQSTCQISRSFTTCACAIFMEQRNNNNNDPYGSWVPSHWLPKQGDGGRRYQNEGSKGLKDDGTESKKGAEWSAWSYGVADQRWPGLAWGPESRVGN